MVRNLSNKQENGLYKYVVQKDSNAAYKAEKESKISTYGRRTYVSKLLDLFKSDKTPTSEYWLEVGE